MNKKGIALLFITLMLFTCFSVVQAQNTPSKQNNVTTLLTPKIKQDLFTREIIDTVSSDVLSTITIGDIITTLRNHIETTIKNPIQKNQLLGSLDESTKDLNTLSLPQETSLIKMKTRLADLKQQQANTKYHNFLFGFFPVLATVKTIIPSFEMNLTQIPVQNLGNLTVKFEIFVKTIPFLEFITTRQLGLTQTTRIWPAIGGRITISGITLCIIAFGPRIKWIRSSLLNK